MGPKRRHTNTDPDGFPQGQDRMTVFVDNDDNMLFVAASHEAQPLPVVTQLRRFAGALWNFFQWVNPAAHNPAPAAQAPAAQPVVPNTAWGMIATGWNAVRNLWLAAHQPRTAAAPEPAAQPAAAAPQENFFGRLWNGVMHWTQAPINSWSRSIACGMGGGHVYRATHPLPAVQPARNGWWDT